MSVSERLDIVHNFAAVPNPGGPRRSRKPFASLLLQRRFGCYREQMTLSPIRRICVDRGQAAVEGMLLPGCDPDQFLQERPVARTQPRRAQGVVLQVRLRCGLQGCVLWRGWESLSKGYRTPPRRKSQIHVPDTTQLRRRR